jgi:VanZ family protein
VKPFAPALLLFAAIVGVAPAIGHVRDFLFATFPEDSVRFLAAGFAAAAGGIFLYAVVRIRRRRRLRYGGLLVVLGLLWVQTTGLATDQVEVDVVEKVHVLEYGTLAFLLYRGFLRQRSGAGDAGLVILTFCGVALAGVAEEWVQWLAPQRVGEIRDVALNVTAGLTGIVFALCLAPPASWSWRLGAGGRRRVARGAALVVLALGLFFFVAHVGYEIDDPEVGRFRSRFTADELRELSERRKAAWSDDPPSELPTWGVEDTYLTEAAWQAGHRNGSLENGVFLEAWLANRILEKYYAPFLDLESFRGSGRHRFSPGERRDLAKKKGRHDPETYLSPVGSGRIFPISKPLFLVVLAVVVGGVRIVGGRDRPLLGRRAGARAGGRKALRPSTLPGRRGSIRVERLELDLDLPLLAVALEGQPHGGADAGFFEGQDQVTDGLDTLAVDGHDDVAEDVLAAARLPEALDAGAGRRTAGNRVADDDAPYARAPGELVGDQTHADAGTDRLAVFDELGNQLADRVDRDREADAGRRAARTVDRRVDADQPAR